MSMDALLKKVNTMSKQLNAIEHAMEEQEQYTQRECLRFYGIPEGSYKDTENVIIKTVKKHLDITLQPRNVACSHRIISRAKPDQQRQHATSKAIIVKFSSYNISQSVFDTNEAHLTTPGFTGVLINS